MALRCFTSPGQEGVIQPVDAQIDARHDLVTGETHKGKEKPSTRKAKAKRSMVHLEI